MTRGFFNHKGRPGMTGGSLPRNNLTQLFLILKGSSRSGNYGHAGRKGKRGGSASNSISADIETLNNYFKGSTDHSLTSLLTQKEISKKFNLPFPEYHASLLSNMEKAKKQLEGKSLSPFDLRGVNYAYPFESGITSSQTAESKVKLSKSIDKIYQDTQNYLGSTPIKLYRANIVNQNLGVVQSWTSNKAIAERFFQQRQNEGQPVELLEKTFDPKDIFSTYKTGLGEPSEEEYLVLNK